jgi:hypothetical protein
LLPLAGGALSRICAAPWINGAISPAVSDESGDSRS